jgi:hypothetical protein
VAWVVAVVVRGQCWSPVVGGGVVVVVVVVVHG